MIKITDLTFKYETDAPPALKDINLEIPKGQWLTVIGKNGSGKSTLARQLNGLLLPEAGQVIVDGLNTLDHQEIWQIREKVSFVFQNPDNQFIASSVEDDIAFGLENLGLDPVEISKRVDNALQLIRLQDKRKMEPYLLSGGEKQRVAIAGAIAMASEYLVLDEPTSMLDPQMRESVLDNLKYLHQQMGMSIIYVTNEMEEVINAERVIVLDEGRLVKDGTPKEIFSDIEWLQSRDLDLPQIAHLSAMLTDIGYDQCRGILDTDELLERLLCTR